MPAYQNLRAKFNPFLQTSQHFKQIFINFFKEIFSLNLEKFVDKLVSKGELKYYSSLLQKKFRYEEKKFIAEGKKLIEEALASGFECEIVFASQHFEEANPAYCSKLPSRVTKYEALNNHEFLKLCDTETPQGIAAVFHQKETKNKIKKDEGIIAALENISDPGNLGTIFRNCDWFGVKSIILSSECAEAYNPKVIRASMGSLFHLNVHRVENFCKSLEMLKSYGYEILCADLTGESVFEMDFPENSIIVFANESQGPSQEVIGIARVVTIPKFGRAESLNVANASAVILGSMRSNLKTPTKHQI
jgi:RNA methyltransferase, TrmH family